MLATFTSNSMPDVLAHQLDGIAVMAPGVAGAPFTPMQRTALLPQVLLAVTHTLPVVKVPYCTLMEVDPWPDKIIAPDGTVHVYVTPAPCDGQLYTTDWPHKPLVGPAMLLGCDGKPGATVLHLTTDVIPQTLVTLTHILPAAL